MITSLFAWVFIQRGKLNYNSEGRFYSPEDGVVYHEQTKEVFGILVLIGLILTGLFIVRITGKKTLRVNNFLAALKPRYRASIS